MINFWNWMEEKDYGCMYITGPQIYDAKLERTPKQMLIGYMVEYLIDLGAWMDYVHVHGNTGIEVIYSHLYKAIMQFEDKVANTELENIKDVKSKHDMWKEDYSDIVTWEDFDKNWFWCNKCNSYQKGGCICYAR